MIPRLRAQEDLRQYTAMGLAFGSFGKDSKKKLAELNREAGHDKTSRKLSKGEAQIVNASIGIGRG